MNQDFSSFQNYQPGEDQEIPFVQIKNASYFRAKARAALKGKFINTAVLAFLHNLIVGAIAVVASVAMVVGMLPSMLADPTGEVVINATYLATMGIGYVIMGLGYVFLGGPVIAGLFRTCLEIVDGKEVSTENLFCYFKKNYWKSVKLYALYGLILLAVSIPMLGFELVALLAGLGGPLYTVFGLVFYVISLVLEVYFALRYIPAFFILAEYPEMRTVDILRSASSMMRGRKKKLLCLLLSFIGWALVAILGVCCTCGFGSLAALPALMAYIVPSMAAFYDDAANREAARQAEFPSLDPDDYKVEEEKTDEA